MTKIIYNNEARNDPERLQEVQHDLLEAATAGETMIDLVNQIAEINAALPQGIVPGLEEPMRRVRVEIFTLQRELKQTFGRMPERAVNMTYLGNLAARRYGVIREE